MAEETSLKQLIQKMTGAGMPDIVQAVVTKFDPDPIEMTLTETPKVKLTEKSLIIPPARRWRMDLGVEYHLLCFNGQHVYYVLDRVKEYKEDG